jgi:hypothetical protein
VQAHQAGSRRTSRKPTVCAERRLQTPRQRGIAEQAAHPQDGRAAMALDDQDLSLRHGLALTVREPPSLYRQSMTPLLMAIKSGDRRWSRRGNLATTPTRRAQVLIGCCRRERDMICTALRLSC